MSASARSLSAAEAEATHSEPCRFPPAVIVANPAEIATAAAPGRPVTMLSPPGFACFAGALLWQTILVDSGWTGPSLLDCADAPGRAVEALRLGWQAAPFGIILRAAPAISARIAAIAQESTVVFLEAPPPALDLSRDGARKRLVAWLAG